MSITGIQLSNFRNFTDKTIKFSDGITVIIGDNAAGKTNILESVAMLATGKSFKAKLEQELVKIDEEIARVKGKIIYDEKSDLEIILTRGEVNGTTARISRKKFLVNGVARRLVDFVGHAKVVLFAPADMELVTESPSIRRKFLDTVLSQVDREYRRSLLSYEKGLRQRNRLLFRIREEGISRSQLLFWNTLLIKNGDYLSTKRAEFIDFVNAIPAIDQHSFTLEYDRSAISQTRLEQYASEEVAAATTLVGPHRDDFIFEDKSEEERAISRDLAAFGSRGEQRMAVLWLKIAELQYIEEVSGQKPTLLLDDIFSELDHEHREKVFQLAKKQQTIITTADPHFVLDIPNVEKIQL